MKTLKTAIVSAAIIGFMAGPIADAKIKDKDFAKLPVAEQTDIARADYSKRLRLMGADDATARQLAYSSYFDSFLSTRVVWTNLIARYKKAKKIPGGKLSKTLIGRGAADRVDYAAEPPTYRAPDGAVKLLSDITQADVDALIVGRDSNAEVRAIIAGERPFTSGTSAQ